MRDKESERRCLLRREAAPKESLIRFVCAPSGEVVADLAETLPGRGAWVSASREVLAEVITRKLFARAFAKPCTVADSLPQQIEAQFQARLLQGISLARKAGAFIAGFEKVEAAIRSGEVAALLHATDAAADGCRKLNGIAQNIPIWQCFSRVQLSQIAGTENTVHAAIGYGKGGAFFLEESRRFALFLGKTLL